MKKGQIKIQTEGQTCPNCGSDKLVKNGWVYHEGGGKTQQWKCRDCGKFFVATAAVATVKETQQGVAQPIIAKEQPVKVPASNLGINETELRKKHDVAYKIKLAAESLQKGTYLEEHEFLKLCNVGAGTGFRRIIDSMAFSKYRGTAQKITYWSHPESIEKMKGEGVLN